MTDCIFLRASGPSRVTEVPPGAYTLATVLFTSVVAFADEALWLVSPLPCLNSNIPLFALPEKSSDYSQDEERSSPSENHFTVQRISPGALRETRVSLKYKKRLGALAKTSKRLKLWLKPLGKTSPRMLV